MTDQPEPAPWTTAGAARALRHQLTALRDAGLSHALPSAGALGEAARRGRTPARSPAPRASEPRPVRTPAAAAPVSQPPAPRRPGGQPVIVPSVAAAELEAMGGRRAAKLAAMAHEVAKCVACGLCTSRTQTAFSRGHPDSPLMLIGEAPGADEDQQGRPFVGRAGQLLDKILRDGMKYDPAKVYIANVLKCRPPGNRNPEPMEIEACRGWLERQIEIVDPAVIIALGRFPAQWLLNSDEPIGRLRGRLWDVGSRKVLCTYHPAYLLRNPSANAEVWKDVQLVMDYFGRGNPVELRGE